MSVAYIIGAGVSGLAAATKLAEAGIPTRLYEATATAGGRAATRRDAKLGDIDLGLHSVRRNDKALMEYLVRIGARENWQAQQTPLALPYAPMLDYLWFAWQLFTHGTPASRLAQPQSPLAQEWVAPYARAILGQHENSLPANAMAKAMFRQSEWLRPQQSLAEGLTTPALSYLDEAGGSIYFSHALKQITYMPEEPATLHFTRKKITLAAEDILILATPAATTAKLLPDIAIPPAGSPSITCHFEVAHREAPSTRALIDAPADLIDYRMGRISLSCRVADSHWHSAPESYVLRLWRWLQQEHPYLRACAVPPYAILREKQGGHSMTQKTLPTPALPPRTLLAGDWLDNTQPASLNQAARAGHEAAEAAIRLIGPRPKPHQRNPYY